MICDCDLGEKMEISVKLLLSFSIIVFNMMKILVKTFIIKIFAWINVFKIVWLPFCFRSSRLQMFFKKAVLENFETFTGKHLCWSLFLVKMQAGGTLFLRWLAWLI